MPICAIVCVLFASAAGAKPLAMKLAPEFDGIEPDVVFGRKADLWKGDLRFGEWQATVPAPFDIRTWTWEALMPESRPDEELRVDVERTTFQFELRSSANAAAPAFAQCVAQGHFAVHTRHTERVTDETEITLPGYPRIDCKLAGARAGQMSLRPELVTQRDSGLLRFGERLWTLQSVNNLASQRSSFPLARFGYEVRDEGEVVAAVETAGKGRVWLHPKISVAEREELAVALAALLYYGVLLESQDF
jgi:hypothetical protein